MNDFDYSLPRDRIAQEPLRRRTDSRLMALDRGAGDPSAAPPLRHARFRDLPSLLRPGDILVMNDTRVVPARLVGVRATGGRVPVLLVRRCEGSPAAGPGADGGAGSGESAARAGGQAGAAAANGPWWEVLAEGGRRLVGETLRFGRLRGTMTGWESGRGRMRFDADPLGRAAGSARRAPLPPYIKRPAGSDPRRASDLRRYQTVYARAAGSIAAPTAGLHFTRDLLARLARRGVATTALTLHVGLGTFRPVREASIERHRMEAEWYELGEEAARAIRAAKAEGRRVIAVGTTTCRALESAARGPGLVPHAAWTDLFIYPPFEFRVADGLVTNFHLPKSTLLMLVCAFAGRERVLAAYAEAARAGYRFYSYGDAMLVV